MMILMTCHSDKKDHIKGFETNDVAFSVAPCEE